METVADPVTWAGATSFGWLRAWSQNLRARQETRREARLDSKLVPGETRFFDAYCHGGERQREVLAIDYDFLIRPAVRRELRRSAAGQTSDPGVLESEFLAAEPAGDLSAFRANMRYLRACIRGIA